MNLPDVQFSPSVLRISGLRAAIGGTEILRGIDLEVKSGEVHAVMGPNGAGKSTLGKVLMGHPSYEVLSGSVTLDGRELLGLATPERARAGLFFAPQDSVEVPGVSLADVIEKSTDAKAPYAELIERMRAEAAGIGLEQSLVERGLNVDCSGGEKKRIETLQLVMLEPKIAILDEIDSGLDIDVLRDVARRIEDLTRPVTKSGVSDLARKSRPGKNLGVLAITHYRRLLNELHPDVIHVLVDGRIVAQGGMDLADELERSGYGGYEPATPVPAAVSI